MLEGAIQQGELGEGGYETWILLGETRNMDEREEAGMRALLEGVKRAEEAGAPGSGMLVSFVKIRNVTPWLTWTHPQVTGDLIHERILRSRIAYDALALVPS